MLAVTTLEKMLLSGEVKGSGRGALKFLAVEERPVSLLKAFRGEPRRQAWGLELRRACTSKSSDEISIEGEGTNLILDGEMFRTQIGRPIVLKPAQPLSFVRLAV